MATTDRFLHLDAAEATRQWRDILARDWRPAGKRQVDFVPVEVVASLALLFVVNPSSQGGSDWTRYHPLAQQLSAVCKRPPGSLVEKGRNLLGVRSQGAKGERELFELIVDRPEAAFTLWGVALAGARAAGIGNDQLPDILDRGGAVELLGQAELGTDLAALVREERGNYEDDDSTSERAAIAMVRIGQHRFAADVAANYLHRCGFCGLDTNRLPASRLLIASHVKPWRHGTTKERLDPRNGIAACPTHDAAFDTGLLTVTADGRVHSAGLLRDATERDQAAHAMFTTTVQDQLVVDPAHRPRPAYLAWHHDRIWRNGIGPLR